MLFLLLSCFLQELFASLVLTARIVYSQELPDCYFERQIKQEKLNQGKIKGQRKKQNTREQSMVSVFPQRGAQFEGASTIV